MTIIRLLILINIKNLNILGSSITKTKKIFFIKIVFAKYLTKISALCIGGVFHIAFSAKLAYQKWLFSFMICTFKLYFAVKLASKMAHLKGFHPSCTDDMFFHQQIWYYKTCASMTSFLHELMQNVCYFLFQRLLTKIALKRFIFSIHGLILCEVLKQT